jgi:hypothetical protein
MADLYSQYRAENILRSTIGVVISHLIKKFPFFEISEEQLSILSVALFIFNKFPRILKNPPDIFIEIHLPELAGYNAFNLRLEEYNLTIGCSGYDYNDCGGDSYSKEIVDINLLEFEETVLVEEFDELHIWADAFIRANGKFQLTIESNIPLYNETDLYDPSLKDEDDGNDLTDR